MKLFKFQVSNIEVNLLKNVYIFIYEYKPVNISLNIERNTKNGLKNFK